MKRTETSVFNEERKRGLCVFLGEEHAPDGSVRQFREYRRGTKLVMRVYTLGQFAPRDGYFTWIESEDCRERIAFPLEKRS